MPSLSGGRRHIARGRFSVCLLVSVFTFAVSAQEQIDLETAAPIEIDAESETGSMLDKFDLRLGVLAAARPEYEGSRQYDIDVVPYARLSWNKWVVLRARSIDVNLLRTDWFRAGPMLKSRRGRNEDNDGSLSGLGDVDRAFESGAFVRFKNGPYRFRVNALYDFADAHDGFVMEMQAGLHVPLDKPWFNVQVSTTWVDDNYMSTFYGVSAIQSRRSRFAQYNADGGFKNVRISVGSRLKLTEHISMLSSVGYSRLLGDAAASPIIREHGERNQFFAIVGATYRF